MRDYYRSYICHSTGAEILRNKINQSKDNECKCFTPCVKLHHYDCPLVKKPCPIHGNSFRYGIREGKMESKPFKNLLPHNCTPKKKFDCQSYSTTDFDKEFFQHSQIQTDPEDLKRIYGSNLFVEKTKLFVADKTRKMKKFKHSLYSTSESINQNTQTTVEGNNEGFLRGEIKKTCDVSVSVNSERLFENEESDESTYSSSLKWCFGNKIRSCNSEKPSGKELTDSDIVAITQKIKHEHLINGKVFDAKPKKSSSDFLFFKSKKKLSQVSPTYYFSSSVQSDVDPNKVRESLGSPGKKTNLPPPKQQQQQQKTFGSQEKASENEEQDKYKESSEESSSSEKYQTESSGSVYFTPFILMPAEDTNYNNYKNSETDKKKTEKKIDKAVQFDGLPPKEKESLSTVSTNSLVKKEEYFPIDENEVDDKPDSVITIKEQKKVETYSQNPTTIKSSRDDSLEIQKIDFKSLVLEIVRKVHSSGSSEKKNEGTQTEESFMLSSNNKKVREIKAEESPKNQTQELPNLDKTEVKTGDKTENLNRKNLTLENDKKLDDRKSTSFPENKSTEKNSDDKKGTILENYKDETTVTEEDVTTKKDEGNNTSLSDFSELIKIINRHFNRMIEEPLQIFGDEKSKEKRSHIGTNTDFICVCRDSMEEFLKFKANKQKRFVDVKIQTCNLSDNLGESRKSLENVKIRQSVRIDDGYKDSDIFICKLCAKKICTVMVDVGTSYNPPHLSGEKTVAPTKSTNSSKVTQSTSKAPDTSLNTKVPPTESSVKTPTPPVKSTSPNRKPPDSEKCFKATANYNIEIKTSRVCQEKSTTFSQAPIRENDPEKSRPKNLTPVRSPEATPQRAPPELQKCECERSKGLKADPVAPNDLCPSLPTSPRPGTRIPRPKTSRNSATSSRNTQGSRPQVFHYAATVSLNSPKELMESLQGIEQIKKPSGSSLTLRRSNSSQKRNYENVENTEDVPNGKKFRYDLINFRDNGSLGDYSFVVKDTEFQGSTFFQRKSKINLEKEIGFVWMPSTPQITVVSNHPTYQNIKRLKSEDTLNSQQKSTSAYERTNNLSNLSLNTHNNLVGNENPVHKLYKCSQCKSLIILNPNKNTHSSGVLDVDLGESAR